MEKRKKIVMALVFVLVIFGLFSAFDCAYAYPIYVFRGRVYYDNAPVANATVSLTSVFCCNSPEWSRVCWYHPCQPSNASAPAYLTVRTDQNGYYYISFEQYGDMQYYIIKARANGVSSPRIYVDSTQTQNTRNIYIYTPPEPPEPPCVPYCP
ncbi:MAG: carboxypeptidase regulatory-like domain-containing protein [Desulfobacteraceae bacterium]|nr:MAG: carboxypeptidase regulatory-like domain-containing protein [Desulfobacteraceae bacterium]